jgi:hypothetical protein
VCNSVPVATSGTPEDGSDDDALLALFRLIASGDAREISRRLDSSPGLANRAIRRGASRQGPEPFLVPIRHYVYGGDTSLHIAAAAYRTELVERLMAKGAEVRARNRRGAEPLHYAADSSPDAAHWDPAAQRAVIISLITGGADPNALDASGVAPLHRAVRTRGSRAVIALLEHGADLRQPNKSGSTPLHLAVQTTGRSNAGSDAAKEEQRRIIEVLMTHGASATDVDAKGKTVAAAASSDWIRQLLGAT